MFFFNVAPQATDAGGLSSVVPVRVLLTDKEDNAPRFARPEYGAVIDETAEDFSPPLRVTVGLFLIFFMNKFCIFFNYVFFFFYEQIIIIFFNHVFFLNL